MESAPGHQIIPLFLVQKILELIAATKKEVIF